MSGPKVLKAQEPAQVWRLQRGENTTGQREKIVESMKEIKRRNSCVEEGKKRLFEESWVRTRQDASKREE